MQNIGPTAPVVHPRRGQRAFRPPPSGARLHRVMTASLKVAFVGTHGVGKTTLCYELAAELKRRDKGVDLVKEVARRCPLPINEGTTVEAQTWILHAQIAEEIAIGSQAEVVVCDRAVLDNYAYLVARAGRREAFDALVRDWVGTYDALIKVPVTAPPTFDGTRAVSLAFQREIDETIEQLIAAFDVPVMRLEAAERPGWLRRVMEHLRLDRIAAVLMLCTLAACAPSATIATGPVPVAAPAADAFTGFPDAPVVPTVGPSTAAAIAKARADSAKLPYTSADVAFMQGMISHHAQAVAMSRLAPTRTKNRAILTLAARIINAQQDEIRTMQTWLADRQQPVQEARPMGMRHEMEGMTHDMLMPGMLTEDEVLALGRARDAEFDERFLRKMIQHHRGATAMVATLFATPGGGEELTVFKFAADVNVDQTTEIARMELMLVQLVVNRAAP
ncbi:MAG: hypothetical protein RLZZ63_659 [Gemmatimonadota bacterium]